MSEADLPEVDPLPTHSHVMHALYELDDYDSEDGIPKWEVVKHVVDRTGLEPADVIDSIGFLKRHGEIYEPRPDHLRRTEQNDERWERFGTACDWQEALVEARATIGRGLRPRELVDRYDVEGEEIEELVARATLEVDHAGNEKLTLEDLDGALERMDDREVLTDGGGGHSSPDLLVPSGLSREDKQEVYGTLNPSLKLMNSDELRDELDRIVESSEADGGRIVGTTGQDHVEVELLFSPHNAGIELGVFTDGLDECPDHIYVGQTPRMRKWSTDYGLISEWAGGEENVSIMHKRGREYALDLSGKYPFECSMNRRYDCGHTAYGPPRRLPSECPECKPVATDGGTVPAGTEHDPQVQDPRGSRSNAEQGAQGFAEKASCPFCEKQMFGGSIPEHIRAEHNPDESGGRDE